MKRYYRLNFKTTSGTRQIWCYRLSQTTFQVVDKSGDRIDELVIANAQDIISLRPVKMNLKYAELEVAP